MAAKKRPIGRKAVRALTKLLCLSSLWKVNNKNNYFISRYKFLVPNLSSQLQQAYVSFDYSVLTYNSLSGSQQLVNRVATHKCLALDSYLDEKVSFHGTNFC